MMLQIKKKYKYLSDKLKKIKIKSVTRLKFIDIRLIINIIFLKIFFIKLVLLKAPTLLFRLL